MPRTRGAKDISPFTRGRVIGQRDCGRSIREIASDLGLTKSVVHSIVSSFINEHKTAAEKRRGRRKKVTDKAKRIIIRETRREPQQSADTLARKAAVSSKTVRRILHAEGYHGRVARKKPLLSQRNIKQRLDWARTMKERTLEFWRSVVFTDESQFEQFGFKRRQWVWRTPADTYQDKYLHPTVKFGGLRVMVWGAIWYGGRSQLVIITERLNAKNYVKLLEDHLLPLFHQGVLHYETNTLQEDNAPCHVAQFAVRWKEENEIQRLPWPAQSPDMNPIEHVWDHMQRELKKITPPPSSKEALQCYLIEIWENIDQGIINNLIDTMPRRVQALQKARGGHTKY